MLYGRLVLLLVVILDHPHITGFLHHRRRPAADGRAGRQWLPARLPAALPGAGALAGAPGRGATTNAPQGPRLTSTRRRSRCARDRGSEATKRALARPLPRRRGPLTGSSTAWWCRGGAQIGGMTAKSAFQVRVSPRGRGWAAARAARPAQHGPPAGAQPGRGRQERVAKCMLGTARRRPGVSALAGRSDLAARLVSSAAAGEKRARGCCRRRLPLRQCPRHPPAHPRRAPQRHPACSRCYQACVATSVARAVHPVKGWLPMPPPPPSSYCSHRYPVAA